MPISVLSAIRQASKSSITVKGGKFLEAMAEADTIVFDKTGTLTKATPHVVDVVSFCNESSDELLRIAACLEEHFPHSMARAVVDAASEKNLVHEEVHSKVSYIVAHGISTTVEGRRQLSEAIILYLKMRAVWFRKVCRRSSMHCQRNIHICIWQ